MPVAGRRERLVWGITFVALGLAALSVLAQVYLFGQSRFLTIDEFQWGHATWLVSQGQVPYRDFYEHHLPLGYVLHAPLLDDADGFVANTLRLRHIAFFYMLAALGCLAWASWRTHRSGPEVLLLMSVVPSVGFGLMSAIDYRGDNWAAFTLIASLSLIEAARHTRSWVAAAGAGALFALAIGMTQKIALLGGGAVAVLLAGGVLARSDAARRRLGAFRMERPGAFVAGGLAIAALVLVAALALGILGQAYEINVLQSLRHERLYPGLGVGQFLEPYLTETAASSIALLAATAIYLAGGTRSFWALPLAGALAGGALIKAPFPYNFVLTAWLFGVCAVRGWCAVVRRTQPSASNDRVAALWPLLYLAPLAILPQQLGFVSGTSTLDDQLRLLEQVERYTDPDDVVIDSAGSALFRPNRGYHWYHGRAHVQMFADWFDRQLVPQMRESQAPLWIRTVRFDLLPKPAARYLLTHYVPLDGDLHVLGFTTRPTGPDEHRTGRIDIVRGGRYYVTALDAGSRGAVGASGGGHSAPPGNTLSIDGTPVDGPTIELEVGAHDVSILPGTPSMRFSYLPPEAFGPPARAQHHTRLFEYRRSRRPAERDPT